MNLFRTTLDHSKCLKRKDHWIGTLLFTTLTAGIYLFAKNSINNTDDEKSSEQKSDL